MVPFVKVVPAFGVCIFTTPKLDDGNVVWAQRNGSNLTPFRCARTSSHQQKLIQGHHLTLPRVTTHRPLVELAHLAQTKHRKPQITRHLFNQRRKWDHNAPLHNSPATSSRQDFLPNHPQVSVSYPALLGCVVRHIRLHNI